LKGDFHIADWEVQPQLNCIRRGDQSHHLEPKVMQVLVHLAAHSNEVLSKDRLIQAVWPDTFVGEDVLTRSISEIRRAFEDDARAPRIVQTIPKAGYRLIAQVEVSAESVPPPVAPAAHSLGNGSGSAVSAVVAPAAAPPVLPPAPAPDQQRTWGLNFWIPSLVSASVVLLVAVLAWHFWTPRAPRHSASALRTVPFTSYPGNQSQPAFSPDGNQVAFVWNGSSRDNYDIYVKVIGAETPLRLTSDPAEDFSPVWSPDGRFIAFLRFSDADRGIYLLPANGGTARKIFTPTGKIEWERGALSWSPDGKRLVFPDGKSASTPSRIFSLTLDSLQAHSISTPPERWDGDGDPVFSPDGTRIAFIRAIEAAIRDVYIMEADGSDVRRVTFDNRAVESLAWDADGQSIIFSSDRGGRPSLWRLRLEKGATPERIEVGGEDATGPAVAAKGNRLAYSKSKSNWSIMRVNLHSANGKDGARFTPLFSGTLQDSSPHYSPDGSRIAFQSWRSGTQEIWFCNGDGSSPVKLTSFAGPLTGSPSWSPDGTRIAFDARPNGHSHIFFMTTEGSLPKAATSGESNDIVPSWSHDGQWIYFSSNRSGSWQVWKVSPNGGEPQQVTRGGGFIAAESPDRRWLYYTKADVAGLWRAPIAGATPEHPEEKVLDSPRLGYWGYWSLTPEGVYYLRNNAIEFKNATSGAVTRVLQLDHTPPPFAGITVSRNSTWLLFTDITEVSSNITLVENFK